MFFRLLFYYPLLFCPDLDTVALSSKLEAGATKGAQKPDPPDILDRQKCCLALAALRHSKWYQVWLQLSFSTLFVFSSQSLVTLL